MISFVEGGLRPLSPRAFGTHLAPVACGGGVFTTLGVVRGRPLLLEAHLRRLAREADRAGLTQVSARAQRRILTAVMRANRASDCVIRLGWVSDSGRPHPFALCEPPRRTPRRVVLQVVHAEGPPQGGYAKSEHLLRWQSLRHQASEIGVFDLLVVRDGRLTETTRFNLFLELHGRLCTPPDHEVFCGWARSSLLTHPRASARALPLKPAHLAAATRVLLVNSVRGVVEVDRVQGLARGLSWRRPQHLPPFPGAQFAFTGTD